MCARSNRAHSRRNAESTSSFTDLASGTFPCKAATTALARWIVATAIYGVNLALLTRPPPLSIRHTIVGHDTKNQACAASYPVKPPFCDQTNAISALVERVRPAETSHPYQSHPRSLSVQEAHRTTAYDVPAARSPRIRANTMPTPRAELEHDVTVQL